MLYFDQWRCQTWKVCLLKWLRFQLELVRADGADLILNWFYEPYVRVSSVWCTGNKSSWNWTKKGLELRCSKHEHQNNEKKIRWCTSMNGALEYEITRHWCFHSNANKMLFVWTILDTVIWWNRRKFAYNNLSVWTFFWLRTWSECLGVRSQFEWQKTRNMACTLSIWNAIYCRDEFVCDFFRFTEKKNHLLKSIVRRK